jgi:hypothetical protein
MRPRYLYHVAPGDEDTRRSIRRFGLLPGLPSSTDRWLPDSVRDQRRGVYGLTVRPSADVVRADEDVYRVELPRGLRTYRDHTIWRGQVGWARVVPRRIPPTWVTLVSRADDV